MKKLNIKIDTTKYKEPDQRDVDEAKWFIRGREGMAETLENIVRKALIKAAEKIASLCINNKGKTKAKDFKIDANKKVFEKIEIIMEQLEEDILIETMTYASINENGRQNTSILINKLLKLGRDNNDLRTTLYSYLYRFLYDIEAIVASFMLYMEDYPTKSKKEAVSEIKKAIFSIYTTPNVKNAMKADNIAKMQAKYIRTRGVHKDDMPVGYMGDSNSYANNIIRLAKSTLKIGWAYSQAKEFEEMGAIGYIQLRGSSYPCQTCDSLTGVYETLEGIYERPEVHPSCQCYRIPLFKK